MPEPHLSIVIPAYNEAQRIGDSLGKVRQFLAAQPYPAELWVVDDGSTDATAEIVSKALAAFPLSRLLQNERNRGKGFSVRRGVLEARGEFVLFSDSDLSTPIEEAAKLLEAL